MAIEVGPGYVSPTSGGFAAPSMVIPSAPAVPLPSDAYLAGAPIAAPAAPAYTIPANLLAPAAAPGNGGTYQAKSFFANIWDQFIGPLFTGIANFFSGLFGKK